MQSEIKVLPVKLQDGSVIKFQVTPVTDIETEQSRPGEEIESDVSLNIRPLKEITDAISEISKSIKEAIDAAKPTKASVEFGVEFGYQSGQITAVIVKGSGKANLKISLEWDNSD